jgi:hypothetical protein
LDRRNAARVTLGVLNRLIAGPTRRTLMAKKKNKKRRNSLNDAMAWFVTLVPALLAAMAAFWNAREQGFLDDGLTGKGKGKGKRGKGSRKRSA